MIKRRDERTTRFFESMVRATARKNFADALALFERFRGVRCDDNFQFLLQDLAQDDREALLEKGPFSDYLVSPVKKAVIAEWVEKDFPWCLGKIIEWEMEYDFLGKNSSSEINFHFSRPVFIEHFDLLPATWKERLFELGEMSRGVSLRWLLEDPPDHLDQESLHKIREEVAKSRAWNLHDHLSVAAEVIQKCEFLSDELRSDLANRVVESSYYDWEIELAEKWLERIPAEFSHKARKRLPLKSRGREEHPDWQNKQTPKLLKRLNLNPDELLSDKAKRWQPDFHEKMLAQFKGLSPQDSLALLDAKQGFHYEDELYRHLPIDLQAALIANVLKIESVRDDHLMRKTAQRIAIEWAEDEPVLTARWALTLPHGKTRDDCLAKAYLFWASRDVEEAEAWGRSPSSAKDRKTLSLN